MRSQETLEASKILKCETIFYDLKELNFIDDAKHKKINEKGIPLTLPMSSGRLLNHFFRQLNSEDVLEQSISVKSSTPFFIF